MEEASEPRWLFSVGGPKEQDQARLRRQCMAPAPLVVNGGQWYIGCQLEEDHAEEDHSVTVRWKR